MVMMIIMMSWMISFDVIDIDTSLAGSWASIRPRAIALYIDVYSSSQKSPGALFLNQLTLLLKNLVIISSLNLDVTAYAALVVGHG